MPNWCSQDLLIAGPQRVRRIFMDELKAKPEKMLKEFVPLPPDGEHLIWSEKLWGTKWGDVDTVVLSDGLVRGQKVTSICFRSAWSPADQLIKNISAQFPELVFGLSYTEEADQFCGYQIWKGGIREVFYEPNLEPPRPTQFKDRTDWFEEYISWRETLTNDLHESCYRDVISLVRGKQPVTTQ